MEIIIQRICPCSTPGNLKAFAEIFLDGIAIKDCRIIQQENQAAWLSMPQKTWKDAAGITKYSAVVSLPKHMHMAVQTAVLNAWKEYAHE